MSDNPAFRELCRVIDEHNNLARYIGLLGPNYTHILENVLRPTKFDGAPYQILPSEIWSLIMSFLIMDERVPLAQTCRQIYNSLICRSDLKKKDGKYSYKGLWFDGNYWGYGNEQLKFRHFADLKRPSKALFNEELVSRNSTIYYKRIDRLLVFRGRIHICLHCYKIDFIEIWSKGVRERNLQFYPVCRWCNPAGTYCEKYNDRMRKMFIACGESYYISLM